MYNIDDLNRDLAELELGGARVMTIGYSLLGRPIKAVFKGDASGGQVLVQAAMHAREYITTPLVIEMMKNYSGSGGVWCVPMSNPDGVMLCVDGLDSVADDNLKSFLLDVNGGSTDFSQWKANARAVDLNVNWNANWGEGAQNVTRPAPGNYVGAFPLSEPENIALWEFTNKILPNVTLSYHAKGNVIFWGFGCIKPYYDEALRLSDSTGYPLLESTDSAGGYKDWYTAVTAKLGLTFEVASASETFPIPLDRLPDIYKANKDVLQISSVIAAEIEADRG